MIAARLGGKTFGQVENLAAQAAITVDPDLAERAREHAERNRARVVLRRERSGAASLSGYDLPPAETLAAHAATCARAQLYKDSRRSPACSRTSAGDGLPGPDQRDQRGGQDRGGPAGRGPGRAGEGAFRGEPEPDDPGAPAPDGSGGSDCPCTTCDGRCAPPDDAPGDDDAADDDGREDGEPGDGGPGDGGPGGGPDDDGGPPASPASPPPSQRPQSPPSQSPPPEPPPPEPPPPPSSSPWSAPPSSPAPPKPIDLTIPLATLLGPRRRPGESHGFGPLDPALCRALAALAAASPHTTACVTVTDHNGHAIGHGCLRAGRRKAQLPGPPTRP